ncbi:MAG: DUF721 domain-containing protein [Bacteroidales bacterium]|nr:DUF721 domain-containing protein [Bacteroidales bacterium]
MKFHNEYSIGEAINLFLNEYKINKDYQKKQIEQIWRKAMGIVIAQYTSKVMLADDTLTVYISHPIVKHDLLYNRQKAIAIMNKQLGDNIIKTLEIK